MKIFLQFPSLDDIGLKAQEDKHDIGLDCLFEKCHINPNKPSLNAIGRAGKDTKRVTTLVKLQQSPA